MPTEIAVQALEDQGKTLFSLLGGFWSGFYGDEAGVSAWCRSLNESKLQCDQDADEMADCVGIQTVPAWNRVRWVPLVLSQSAMLTPTPLAYTSTDELGPPGTVASTLTYDWVLPTGLHDCAWIADDPNTPTVFWGRDTTFTIDRTEGAIRFQTNPFQVLVPQQVGQDQQVTLWMAQADFDAGYMGLLFGYVLRIVLASSPNYNSLINAVWDTGLLGTSRAWLDAALAAICDAPICLVDGEVVQTIVQDAERWLITTDHSIYTAAATANIQIFAGQVLAAGQPLTDAFTIVELSQGTPASTALASLTIPITWLRGSFSGPLTWNNALTPLQVSTVNGRTFVSWSLDGNASDVTLFFNTCQNYAIANNVPTLAQMLDTRPVGQRTGDPDAASLPAQINPLDFLVQNVLRYGGNVLTTRAAPFGPNSLGSALISQVVRELIPPQGGLIWTQN